MRVTRLQISHAKLSTRFDLKIEIFLTYVAILEDDKTLKHSRIRTRINVVNAYRDLRFTQFSFIEISYRFSTTLEFLLVSTINNTILKRIF